MSWINDQYFKFTKLCTSHPVWVIALTIIVTAFFAFSIRNIEKDNSLERMLPDDEPIRAFYEEFREHFNLKSMVVIGIEYPEGVFRPEILEQVDRLSKNLAALDDIAKVQSLTTVENITAEDGMINVEPLTDTVPQTPEEIQKLRETLAANSMLAEAFVAKDGQATVLYAQPTYLAYENVNAVIGYNNMKKVIDADTGPGKIYIAGFPVAVGLNNVYMIRDNRVMLPIVLVMVILILWFSFRTFRGIWIPLSVVACASIWTFGTLALLNIKISVISISIPIVLVAMGIADGIHVLNEYYHQVRLGRDNVDAVHHTMNEMNSPVIMTSLTTAAGFLALATSQIIPIKEYGASVAFGIMVAMLFSLSVIPASLVLLGKPKKLAAAKMQKAGLLDRFCAGIGTFSQRYTKIVITAFVVGLIVTGFVSTMLEVHNNPVHYFKKGSALRQADDFLNAHFAGTGEILIQVDGNAPDMLKSPDLLERIEKLQSRLVALPEVGQTSSIIDFLKRMNVVLHDDDPKYDRLPGTKQDMGDEWSEEKGRKKIAQYLLLYEMSGGEELQQMVDFDFQRANVRLYVKSNDSSDYRVVMDALDEIVADLFADGKYGIGTTGAGAINLKVVQYLVMGQVISLTVSFVVVFIMLIMLFRSFLYALIGTIPLVITVSSNFAVMVVSGIALNMGTALIASVIIGVGVDYSIHFIHRYRLERGRSDKLEAVIQTTMATSGRAIMLNAISVGGGFAVLIFSSFLPVFYLGLLVPIVMLVNALAALVVIPAFLKLTRKKLDKGEQTS